MEKRFSMASVRVREARLIPLAGELWLIKIKSPWVTKLAVNESMTQ